MNAPWPHRLRARHPIEYYYYYGAACARTKLHANLRLCVEGVPYLQSSAPGKKGQTCLSLMARESPQSPVHIMKPDDSNDEAAATIEVPEAQEQQQNGHGVRWFLSEI